MNATAEHINTLERLLAICNDGREGYLKASELTDTDNLKQLFNQYANERDKLARQLKDRLNSAGDYVKNQDGDVLGAIHRAWMQLKIALTKLDDRTVLETCKEGDQVALEAYDDALQGDLLYTDLKPFLMDQRAEISKAYQEINRLHLETYKELD